MNKSNINFLLGWFIVGFGIAYILFNSSKWSNEMSVNSSVTSFGNTKIGYLEKKQNVTSPNYARLPSYYRNSNTSFGKNKSTAIVSINNENEGHITANYEVNIDRKSILAEYNGSNTNNYIPETRVESYSSKDRSENKSNNNDNAQITQSISQLAALNGNKSVSIQGSNSIVKSNHGFMAMNTDISNIESSLNINDNAMQKSTNDINPGNGGEMGTPIPVGDGWILLLIMAVGYGSWKGLNDLKGLKI